MLSMNLGYKLVFRFTRLSYAANISDAKPNLQSGAEVKRES